MKIPEKNKDYIHKIVIDLIRNKEDLKLLLQSEFPESSIDFDSAAVNPDCGCVGRIQNLILANQEKVIVLLEKYFEDKNEDELIINIINQDYELMEPQDYSGKIFIIENNEESFSEFVKTMKNQLVVYKGFSTAIDANNKLHIYFI